jgi:hypothetical protein
MAKNPPAKYGNEVVKMGKPPRDVPVGVGSEGGKIARIVANKLFNAIGRPATGDVVRLAPTAAKAVYDKFSKKKKK